LVARLADKCSGSCTLNEANGLWDTTGGALYSTVRHPINTLRGLMFLASALPSPGTGYGGDIMAQMQIYDATSAWGSRLVSGDPRALGQLAGTAIGLKGPSSVSQIAAEGSFQAFLYDANKAGPGFSIGYKAAQNGGDFLRFDAHTLHFGDAKVPVRMVPHLDSRFNTFGQTLKVKHFPWSPLQ
jgi:hypothetical protein